jgi:predicted RNA-binding protein with RPS1 domain
MEGEIVRIEKYGAFCSLMIDERSTQQPRAGGWFPPRLPQGLIHISQLHSSRVERVEDVVSLQDHVWVKVLEVEQRAGEDEHTDKTRFRIKLSMKDAAQDGTRQDLGRQREQVESAKTQLETNLNSMIGMGVARDPMQNLVIKSQRGGVASNTAGMTFRGGYSLVDDDEGEPYQPSRNIDVSSQPDALNSINSHNSKGGLAVAPMGRGRGATLPAWMTSQKKDGRNEGPTGIASPPGSDNSIDSGADQIDGDDGRKRRKHRKSRKHDSKHGSKRKSTRHDRRHDLRKFDSDSYDSDTDVSSRRGRRSHRKEADDKHWRKTKRPRSPSVYSDSKIGGGSREFRDDRKHNHDKDYDRKKRSKRRRSRSHS